MPSRSGGRGREAGEEEEEEEEAAEEVEDFVAACFAFAIKSDALLNSTVTGLQIDRC